MKHLRLLAAAIAAVTVSVSVTAVAGAVTTPGDAAAAPKPTAPSLARAYLAPHGVRLTWTDPRRAYDTLVLHYRRGTAPTRSQGRSVRLDKHATSTVLTALVPGARYGVSLWTRVGTARYSTPVHLSFVAPFADTTAAAGTVRGVVRDKAGHALRGAGIYVTDKDSSVRHAVTSASGAYAVSVPAGIYEVLVDPRRASGGDSDATGYRSELTVVQVRGHRSSTHNFVLAPAGAVTGRVLDRAGHPVRNIAVYEQPVDQVTGTSFDSTLGAATAFTYTVTRSDGTYRLKGALDSAATLCFVAINPLTGAGTGNYADTCDPLPIAVAAGATRKAGDTTLLPSSASTPGTGTVDALVTAPSGRPLARAQVVVISTSDNGGFDIGTHSGATGHSVVPFVQAGPVQVCAVEDGGSATGFRPTCRPVRVVAGRTVHVTLVLPVGAAITGVVTGPHGPVEGVTVSTAAAVVPLSGDDGVGIAVTDRHGRYTMKGLPTGVYALCATRGNASASAPTGTRSGCVGTHVLARAGSTRIADIAVGAAAAVRGVVRTAHGAIAAGRRILLSSGTQFTSTTTGRYRLGGLPAGRVRLCALQLFSSNAGPQACGVARTAYGRSATLNLTLPGTGSVTVRATDTGGHPLSGVDAALLAPCSHDDGGSIYYGCGPVAPYSATKTMRVVAGADTGAHGTVTLAGIRPGHYALCMLAYNAASTEVDVPTAGLTDRCTSSRSITVTDGGTAHAAFALTEGASVSGTVTDPSGKGIPGVFVRVSGAAIGPENDDASFVGGDPVVDATTDADGNYSVRGVVPGDQTVCFDASQAGTSKSGFEDQCIGGAPGGTGDGTAIPFAVGANTGIDQTLQRGPGRGYGPERSAAKLARKPLTRLVVVDGRLVPFRATSPSD